MRRLSASALFLFISGCTSSDKQLRIDDTATMLSVLDPRADKQLTRGFFPVEGLGRWTGRTFSATLKPPPNAGRRGAELVLRFGIAPQSIEVLRSIGLSASVNGVPLSPESYARAGESEYVRDVPASAFQGGNATVDFVLEKALPPNGSERRELGVVATTLGFEAK